MGLAQELTLADAVKPFTTFRYISFDVVSPMIDFESAIEDRLPSSRRTLGSSPSPTISFAH